LSSTEKLALKVRFMAEAYNALTRTDYTNINTLKAAAACLACEPDFRLESMELAVWKSIADDAGAAIPVGIADQRALISCVPCGEQKTTRAAYLYLLCLFGRLTISAPD
jgi:hypothetical protein